MSPHIEEAWRTLGLADRDVHAFHVLRRDVECHHSIICFHAQQAIEKSLKAVLFAQRIEFRRSHDLGYIASLLIQNNIIPPLDIKELSTLNPYAVVFRYDDMDVALVLPNEIAEWVVSVREWAGHEVAAATEAEERLDSTGE